MPKEGKIKIKSGGKLINYITLSITTIAKYPGSAKQLILPRICVASLAALLVI